jgi:hypothetical protein
MDSLAKASAAADHLPLHPGVIVEPFEEEITGSVRRSLLLLLFAVGYVLLIGCVNLANLQLARAIPRAAMVGHRLGFCGFGVRDHRLRLLNHRNVSQSRSSG